MDEAETQQRHGKACGVQASRVCKEFNAASSVEHNNPNQLSIIVGREQVAVEKRADMLHQGSVILDAGESQRMLQAFERRVLLKIEYVRQGLIRHVDIRDHRRQVCLPVHVPSVYFEEPFC